MKFDSQIVPHAWWEMLIMRVGFAWLVWMNFPAAIMNTLQPYPNGLAIFMDLTFMADGHVLAPLRAVLLVALVFYSLNLLMLPALGYITFLLIAHGSLDNSQGAINHSFQPLALIALAQFLVVGWMTIRDKIKGRAMPPFLSQENQRLLIHAAKVLLVACYVSSAVTKLDNSDGQWIMRTPNLAALIAGTNAKYSLNEGAEPDYFSVAAPAFIIEHPTLTRVLGASALGLELFAFLALMGRWPATILGIGLIAMHSVISVVMKLYFDLYEHLCLLFLVNVPFLLYFAGLWAWRLSRMLLRKWEAGRSPATH